MSRAARPPAAALARHLPALMERLRGARYRVGPGELVDLERLLARCACQGQFPLPAHALARVVAPVVCRSAAEQQAFGEHFKAWLAEVPALSRRRDERAARRLRRTKQAPSPGAAKLGTSEPEKSFGARLWRLAAAILVLVALAFLVRWWVLVQFLPVETTQVPARIVERRVPATPRPQALLVNMDRSLWPVAFAGILWLVPLYYAWLYGGILPAWLRRRASGDMPELDRLSLGHPDHALGASWRGISRLCERDPRPDLGLQVEATVQRTADHGGFFTPVYSHRPELPEYLGLIDRRSPEDHLARFAMELMARLEERGLAVRTLFFSRDPRPGVGGSGRGFSSLATLSGQARTERLLIFSDADSFLDPRSGRPWPGLAPLARWRQRFLLTPRTEADWDRREQALAAEGLAPFPISDAGLSAVAEHITAEKAERPVPAPATGRRLERLLAGDSDRWLNDASPASARVRGLLEALADDLGAAGMLWLRACAIFPSISWPVTCHLGRQLKDESGESLFTEERLLQLARLPWFRHGKMPDWLRLELTCGLDRGERERLRSSLRELLAEASLAQAPDGEPEIAQAKGWRSDRALARFLARQGEESPLRDYLFLTFMRGRRPSRLALAAPRRLRTLIRDTDRWSVLVSAILALVATLMIAAWHQLDGVPVGPGLPPTIDIPAVPMPAAAGFPEALIAIVIPTLSVLAVGLSGLKNRRQPASAAEATVPGLVARISQKRLPVLIPWIATSWAGAFIVADFAGSPGELRMSAASLVAVFVLLVYAYVELGFSRDFRRRLLQLEAGLDTGGGAAVAGDVAAFLRGPAATGMKRRLLRVIYAKVRQPSPELVRELFELQHVGALEPRTRSLLERIVRHLEDRARQIDRGEAR